MLDFKIDDKLEAELAMACTVLQRRFVMNLIDGKSQIDAYVAAGGKAKTDNGKHASASQILSNHNSQKYYRYLEQKAMIDAQLSRAEAISILSDIARTKVTDILEFKLIQYEDSNTGKPKSFTNWRIFDSDELPLHVARSIKSVKMTIKGPEIEFRDPMQSIAGLAKMGGWNAPVEVDMTAKQKVEVTPASVSNALTGLMDFL